MMVSAERSQINTNRSGSPAEDSLLAACNERPRAPLLKGIDEFNQGRYWESHETLEQLWRDELRPVRELYQGILEIGVGFHHLRRGNYAGAVKVLGRGLARLREWPETCQGVRVKELQNATRSVYERILELGPDRMGEFEVGSLPRVECL